MNDDTNSDLEDIKRAKRIKSLEYAFCAAILKAKDYPKSIIFQKIINYNTQTIIRLMEILEIHRNDKKEKKQNLRLSNGPHQRFIVFAYFDYDSQGGSGDIVADFDLIEDAKKFIMDSIKDNIEEYEYIEIYDRVNGIFVYKMD